MIQLNSLDIQEFLTEKTLCLNQALHFTIEKEK